MKFHYAVLQSGLWLVCISFVGQVFAQFSVFPTTPKMQETVRIQIATGVIGSNTPFNAHDPRATQITMSANKVTMSLVLTNSGFGESPSQGLDVPIGQFPAGTYQVEVKRMRSDGFEFSSLGTSTFTVAGRSSTEPLWNHTDLWWDARESGWGLNIIHHGLGKIFATWFVYGADRAATWYVIPDGEWVSPTEYRGAIYRTSGPYFAECADSSCATPFNPALVTRTAVGSASLTFNPFSSDSASASFTIDGRTTSKLLTRQSF